MTSDTTTPKARLRAIARRAMTERGLEPDIPPAALAEARALPDSPAREGLPDQTGALWCSIDNDESRDLDQLSVAMRGPESTTLLKVAIADVDALAPRGSAIDQHARVNTTTVYTPGEVFPMLPERLSTDLTSLVEREARAALVIDLVIAADGTVREAVIARALVRNHARLTYDAVAAWLEGRSPEPPAVSARPGLAESLRLQDRAAQAMRQQRHAQGALTLTSVGSQVVFDGDVPSGLRADEKNRAKGLIEDVMIATNAATARYLADRGWSSLRRVLRAPRRWDRIVALARELGSALPAEPDARALDSFLRMRRSASPDRFPELSLSVIKLLGGGEYAVASPGKPLDGHFGLAVRDYTHSTAPNRRFPDLVTQRLLKAALAGGPPPYELTQLQVIAGHCTQQEDAAEKVERLVRKSAAALLLTSHLGQEFDAIVTGASAKGTWVRVWAPPVEGRVIRGEAGLDVGERVRVRLVETDVERGFIDFVRA